jgi:hypothetical protein
MTVVINSIRVEQKNIAEIRATRCGVENRVLRDALRRTQQPRRAAACQSDNRNVIR